MYYISKTHKILLSILIPAKYLKDVIYLSNRALYLSYKDTQIYFISTDFPDCHSLLNPPFSLSLLLWHSLFEDWHILMERMKTSHQLYGFQSVSLTAPQCYISNRDNPDCSVLCELSTKIQDVVLPVRLSLQTFPTCGVSKQRWFLSIFSSLFTFIHLVAKSTTQHMWTTFSSKYKESVLQEGKQWMGDSK